MSDRELKILAQNIITYLSVTNDETKIFSFLRDLLSAKEIEEFSRRFQVAKLLSEKIPYSEIEKQTKMSSTTIARVSKFLTGENRGYNDAIQKLKSITDKHHTGHWS